MNVGVRVRFNGLLATRRFAMGPGERAGFFSARGLEMRTRLGLLAMVKFSRVRGYRINFLLPLGQLVHHVEWQ